MLQVVRRLFRHSHPVRHATLCLLLACAASSFAGAQEALPLRSADALGEQIAEHSAITGMVMVLVRDDEVQFTSYGETFPGSGKRPDAHSLVRLCSLTKIFTTDLLVRLVRSGSVHLTDPLQQFAPDGVHVPRQTLHGPAARAITLGDLATHTSGLPREVGAYPAHTAHFTFPSFDRRWSWLAGQKLLTSPGTSALYSNVAYDLLGDALAKAAGKTYRELVREQIAGPLGMRDTTLAPTAEQCARLLQGSDDEGPCTDTEASAGSGGLYATPADMALLLQSLLRVPGRAAQPPSYLAVYLEPKRLASIEGLDHAGRPSGIGLGWLRLGEPGSPSMILEKTGGGAGFVTYLALSPERHTGIFVAATYGQGPSEGNFFRKVNDVLSAVAGVPALSESTYPVRRASSARRMAASGRRSAGPGVQRRATRRKAARAAR